MQINYGTVIASIPFFLILMLLFPNSFLLPIAKIYQWLKEVQIYAIGKQYIGAWESYTREKNKNMPPGELDLYIRKNKKYMMRRIGEFLYRERTEYHPLEDMFKED